ncbi:tryptophan dimethylallyltransferase-domain-containing protein [Xylariaceae sp. FL0662B]|nr:tryptophan dimethylallyltransferase-domain-containing protein [Xylariaceae sp. FL0662B]
MKMAATQPLPINGNAFCEQIPKVADPELEPKARNGRQPVDVVNSILHFRGKDHQFWWNRTGTQLATLLHFAGYTLPEQYNELLFYALHVIPELGPSLDADGNMRWHSPQTPDGTPLELSWEWGVDGKGVIRTTFEPIGPLAGTDTDPFNRFETAAWIRHLESQQLIVNLDLEWYHHFTKSILPQHLERVQMTDKLNFELAPKGGTYVTRDIKRTGPMVKLYMFPGLRAQELGISNLEVVTQAIQSLPEVQLRSLQPEPLLEYLREAAIKWNMETGIFSFDLVSPTESRIKIYTRAPNTTVDYLIDALTLGGRYDLSLYSKEALDDVKDFWRIFIGNAPDVLPSTRAERDGPGFYFTIRAGNPASPKVYISPLSFCKNDAEVLARLRLYFSTRRDADKMSAQVDNYEKALTSIYGAKLLEERCGSHFYVSCALEKDQLRVVTYLCPQTLAREREAIRARDCCK